MDNTDFKEVFILTTEKRKFNTIEEALEELQAGHVIIVTDDPDRENEGDFICAAQYCTTENMNFQPRQGPDLHAHEHRICP